MPGTQWGSLSGGQSRDTMGTGSGKADPHSPLAPRAGRGTSVPAFLAAPRNAHDYQLTPLKMN